MDQNKMIPKAGSAIVTVTVFLFALFLIINYFIFIAESARRKTVLRSLRG